MVGCLHSPSLCMFVLINIWFWFFSVFRRYWLIVQGDSSLTAHPRPRNRINYTLILLSSLACEGWSDAHNSRELGRPREGCGDVEEEREIEGRSWGGEESKWGNCWVVVMNGFQGERKWHKVSFRAAWYLENTDKLKWASRSHTWQILT